MRNDFVTKREYLERPSAEFPQGSYLEILGDRVTMATGRFSGLGPPSPYWHGGPPFVMFSVSEEWPWQNLFSKKDEHRTMNESIHRDGRIPSNTKSI